MTEEYREYRTGQGVPLTGEYICQSGEIAKLNENDTFPKCPITGSETTWKHENEEPV
ncbi:hypothetical protein SAMN05421676_104119 [Salinibacillus kushneri]|uniref:YjzC-like protein n=1 Tax=Salinibacillus kushneri TaxID=237682 RepID=A0A1I0DR33_9BACI|nr:hypothetical protein [Salinibacillus kushneri]SET34636.1 hypothetical protein SAMN05421676_104119 [Salinibacillus kushneri]